MAAESNRPGTGRIDSGRVSAAERQAAALEALAAAAVSIDKRLGELAGALEHYRPALDKAARIAGSPVGKVLGGFPAPRRPGAPRG